MTTMPGDDALVEVTSVSNPKLQLSAEEGFLISRAFGRQVSVGELVKLSGMPADKAKGALLRLLGQGVFVVVGAANLRPTAPDDPYAGFIFPAAVLQEAVDLTDEQKKRIVFVDMNLGVLSAYKLLAVKRTATAAEIKQGYFRASKEFHPDAFFRRNLGSYKERIDRIFRGMKQAYDLLSDPKRRAVYDENLIGELTPEEEAEIERRIAEKRKVQDDDDRLKRHEARLAEQRNKRNPMLERVKKSQDLMALADKAVVEKRFADAERHARLALEFAPFDADMKARSAVILKWGSQERARSLVKRLGSNLSMVDNEVLVRVGTELAELAHGDAAILVEAAKVLAQAGKGSQAMKVAHDATECGVTNVDAWRLLAQLAERDEKWATAVRAAERWAALAPKETEAKELAKRATTLARP
jgi:curved DNA-binding protein CbpA